MKRQPHQYSGTGWVLVRPIHEMFAELLLDASMRHEQITVELMNDGLIYVAYHKCTEGNQGSDTFRWIAQQLTSFNVVRLTVKEHGFNYRDFARGLLVPVACDWHPSETTAEIAATKAIAVDKDEKKKFEFKGTVYTDGSIRGVVRDRRN